MSAMPYTDTPLSPGTPVSGKAFARILRRGGNQGRRLRVRALQREVLCVALNPVTPAKEKLEAIRAWMSLDAELPRYSKPRLPDGAPVGVPSNVESIAAPVAPDTSMPALRETPMPVGSKLVSAPLPACEDCPD